MVINNKLKEEANAALKSESELRAKNLELKNIFDLNS